MKFPIKMGHWPLQEQFNKLNRVIGVLYRKYPI